MKAVVAANELGPVQNMGLMDRSFRIVLGAAMIGLVLSPVLGNSYNFLAILAIYPCLTGMMGWDPLYSLRRVKTCDINDRNKCGTYGFQVSAAAGKDMACNEGYDCSLSGNQRAQEKRYAE